MGGCRGIAPRPGEGGASATAKPKKANADEDVAEAARAKHSTKTKPWQTKEERRLKVTRLANILTVAIDNEFPEDEVDDI